MLKQKKEWVLRGGDRSRSETLVSTLLEARGVRKELEDQFFSPNFDRDLHDPFSFRHMKKVVDRLLQAAAKDERVLIYGDYDVDGVTSATIMKELLSALGIQADVYLPHRENEGYGMKKGVIEKFVKKGTTLVISVDCGVSNVDEVDFANELGADVIIIDHHIAPSILPNAYAIINPKVQEDGYPFRDLSAGGVAFKVVQGFLKDADGAKFAQSKGVLPGWEKWLLDLVAISTICDSMPIVGENRILVKYGLIVLSKTRRVGLRRLMEKARLTPSTIDAMSVGFYIGPRINAAGRMEHADIAFQLLNTIDDTEAVQLSDRLQKANTDRQKLVERIMGEARDQLRGQEKKFALVVYGANWPAGIVGLVAGKLKDEHYRPTFVVGKAGDSVTGSGRSIEELNIVEALDRLRDDNVLLKFGGHNMACGFSLIDESRVEDFRQKIDQVVSRAIGHLTLSPKLVIDSKLPLDKITEALVGQILQFAPFGQGNERPKFVATNVEVVSVEPVGQTQKHIRSFMRDNNGRVWKAMGFGWKNNGHLPFESGAMLDIVYELTENEWNGNREIQIELVDARETKQAKQSEL